MLFLIHTQDKPDSLQIRKDNRDAHLAYLRTHTIVYAGPTLSAETDGYMNGSCIVIECDSMAAAEEFLANDPYKKAGLTGSATIQPFIQAIANT